MNPDHRPNIEEQTMQHVGHKNWTVGAIGAAFVCMLLLGASAAYAQNPNVTSHDAFQAEIRDDLKSLIVPPQPDDLDWSNDKDSQQNYLDRGIEVTHIRFNHSPGAGGDAMNARWCRGMAFHHADHTGPGEYEPDAGRNDPAVYAHDQTVTIQVRFKSMQPNPQSQGDHIPDTFIRKAMIRAEVIGVDSSGEAPFFLALTQREVHFNGLTPGVSSGSAPADDGEYITFDVDGEIPTGFHYYRLVYNFILTGVYGDGSGPGQFELIDSMDGTVAPPVALESHFYETAELHVYSTMGEPQMPWAPWGSQLLQNPWVSAIAFSGFLAEAFGHTSTEGVATAVTEHLHANHSYSGVEAAYDHTEGRNAYGKGFRGNWATERYDGHFSATLYMKLANGGKVNCVDQAMAVATFTAIATSDSIQLRHGFHFGHVDTATFVGDASSNNPFWEAPEVVSEEVVPSTDHADDQTGWPWNRRYKRSAFAFHVFVYISDDGCYDACFGPVTNTSMARSTAGAYLSHYRDFATARHHTLRGHAVVTSPELKAGVVLILE
jgi:hypothetical protein